MNIDKKYRYGTRRMKTSIRRQRRSGMPDWAIVANIKYGYGRPLSFSRILRTNAPVLSMRANITWGTLE